MAQTRRRRTTKKTTRRKPARRKAQTSDHTLNWVGVGFLVVGLLALFRLGLIGSFFANCLRLVVGNSFLFLAVLVAAYGLWLVISGRVLYLKRRLVAGGGLAYLGVLIFWSGQLMARLSVHSHYILANWRFLASDFRSMTTASDVGGGMLGGIGFGALAPLVSGIGAQVVAVLLVIIGILVLCGVTMAQVFGVCQAIGRGLANLLHRMQAAFADMTAAHAEKAAQAASEKPQEKSQAETQTEEKPKPAAADDFTINAPQAATEPAPKPKPVEKEPEPTTEGTDDASEDLDSGDPAADYQLPSADILTPAPPTDQTVEYNLIKTNRVKLKQTFDSFGVDVTVKAATLGPTVTQYEIQPAVGVKVAKIVNLSNDLALALAAKDIRIEAPIPGKSLIGIEVPNTHVATVGYQEVLEKTPPHPGKPLVIPLGKDVAGNVKTMDLAKMPHLLIAGATGSGKSVMINVIITSILMTAKPTDVRLMLIDPKRVELSVYNGVPHLLTPVITEAKKAPAALNKVLAEMDRRYERFSAAGVRNMGEYNRKVADSSDPSMKKMPYIVMIVDELSDLMMVAGKEVETAIVRLAQMARAAGIHIIIATQRPSVDVITGLIKANIPSRIAFAVSSGVDSRTILDSNGAEKLLGRGDMLYQPVDASKPVRIQGAYIPSEDVEAVVAAITSQVAPAYVPDMAPTETDDVEKQGDSEDDLYDDAKAFVIQQQSASTSMLQRRFRIGYNRAARLIDDLEANSVVGPSEGSKPRKVFIAPDSTDAQ